MFVPEEAEYFFYLQRLLAEGKVPTAQVVEAQAAPNAVGSVAWDFVYYSDKLKRSVRPYSANASLANSVRQRVGQLIDDIHSSSSSSSRRPAKTDDAVTLTVRNTLPRYDTNGEIVDAHSGSLVQHPNGTFFFYGERYRNATGMVRFQWRE